MIDWALVVIASPLILGSMAYMIVWGMHNFDVTSDTIMAWADKQDTFLQKMISCPMCLGTQVSVALTSLHCLAFGLGLWTWTAISILSCLVTLTLLRRVEPLTERKHD